MKEAAYRNAVAHITPQKELVAKANDREPRQKRVDKNNEENVRNHNEKVAAAAATKAAAAGKDIDGNSKLVSNVSLNASNAINTM